MNKNFSFILNIVLVIAVGVLYYLHFSSCNTNCSSATGGATDSSALVKPAVMSPKEIKASKSVYVNLDILYEKYDFIKKIPRQEKFLTK